MDETNAVLALLGKLTLGAAGWIIAYHLWGRHVALTDKVFALTERLATLTEGFKGEISNLRESVKELK